MPHFLSPDQILELHQSLGDQLGWDKRVRDLDLLESAALAPQETRFGEMVHKTLRAQASMYWLSIGLNRPFLEGNEKTGLIACEVFLEINGYELDLTGKEMHELLSGISRGQINTRDKLLTRLRIKVT